MSRCQRGVVELVEDRLWHNADAGAQITESVIKVLSPDRAVDGGAAWVVLLFWRIIKNGRTAFLRQLHDRR